MRNLKLLASLIEEVMHTGGLQNAFWSVLGVKTRDVHIFRPVQLVVLAAESKTGFDLGTVMISDEVRSLKCCQRSLKSPGKVLSFH